MKAQDICIGLFGTCGNSTWRDEFIERYIAESIPYFNPNKSDWKPEDAAIEAQHLVTDSIILFPILSETHGLGSLAETGFSVLQAITNLSENRYIIILIDPKLDEEVFNANPGLGKISNNTRAIITEHIKKLDLHNVCMVNSLDDMLELSLDLVAVQQDLLFIACALQKEKYKLS